jgi:lysophospholipase L1-like esterase
MGTLGLYQALGLKRSIGLFPNTGAGGGAPSLSRFKAAANAVKAGTANARILCIGDSTTAGFGAATNGTMAAAFPLSYPAKLVDALVAGGLPSLGLSMGDGNTASITGYAAYDTRNTFADTTNWTMQTAASIGASLITCVSTATQRWIKAFPGTWDTIELVYINIAAASFPVYINGGGTPVATITPTAGGGTTGLPQRALISVPRAANVSVEVGPNTGGKIYISSMDVWDSTAKKALIYNCGWASAKSTDLNVTSATYRTLNMIQFMAPDLMVLNIGINDYAVTSQANFEAAVTSLVNAARISGDVILCVPNPRTPAGNEAAFRGYIQGLANSLGVLLVDNQLAPPDGLGPYATASANGDINVDGIHPTGQGYNKMAGFVATKILAYI